MGPPTTISGLRAFLGLANYYHTYVENYAQYAAPLMEKLKVPRAIGKKGSKARVTWTPEELDVFELLKKKLTTQLALQTADPDRPYILKVDASDYAIGAVLEQLPKDTEITEFTKDNINAKTPTVPAAFFSRKLTPGQRKNWPVEDKETYAIVSALEKWSGWIGLQPVLVMTDHKTLESWHKRAMDTPSGMTGRRARWHEKLSRFHLTVVHIPGAENQVADAMSRWAYPAGQGYGDISVHGNEEDDEAMDTIIAQERAEEKACCLLQVHNIRDAIAKAMWVKPVVQVRREIATIVAKVRPVEVRTIPKSGEKSLSQPRPGPLQFTFKKPTQKPPAKPSSAPQEPVTQQKEKERVNPHVNFEEGREEPPVPEEIPNREMFPSTNVNPEMGTSSTEEISAPVIPLVNIPPLLTVEMEPPEQEEIQPAVVHAPVALPQAVEPLPLDPSDSVMEQDWGQAYEQCYWFGEWWRKTHANEGEWPERVQVEKGKMYHEGRLCVPFELAARVIREHHAAIGHPGGEKLWKHIQHRYSFPPRSLAYRLAQQIPPQCVVCQASKEPNFQMKTKIHPTPIPARLGDSIAMDIFNLPAVIHHGDRYDCMIVAVDRLSGWVVAVPTCRKGLQAKVVAEEMWQRWWQPFGVPSTVTSDPGPQFIGAWWKILCAAMGVRQVYSQAYHHGANGRAEVAGKTLQQVLRRLHNEDRINWVQALPRAVQNYHDLAGPSGLSPYEIVFGGRLRSMGGIPRHPQVEAPDAQDWIRRGKEMDEAVAAELKKVHQKAVEDINANRATRPRFKVGETVWVLRPRHVGTDKLLSWWIGPCPIVAQKGLDSMVVEIKPGHERAVHTSQLKEFREDQHSGRPVPLHFVKPTEADLGVEIDEWEVEKVLEHKVGEDGQLWFLTKWAGFDAPTWEPIGNFVHRYSLDWAKYCKTQRLRVDIVKHLLLGEGPQ